MKTFLQNLGGEITASTTSDTVGLLARDARNALRGEASKREAEALLRRIDAMTAEWRLVPHAPLNTWLANLRLQLQAV